jgi:hypothetical protein
MKLKDSLEELTQLLTIIRITDNQKAIRASGHFDSM